MRRVTVRVGSALLGAAVCAALTACVGPFAPDGRPAAGGSPAAGVAPPPVGACYQYESGVITPEVVYLPDGGLATPVDCATDHDLETASVGTFRGADARWVELPAENSSAFRGAYATCERASADYLGGDWHLAPVWMILTVPSAARWRAGARWYRCDLARSTGPALPDDARTGSVKDGLRGTRPLLVTCLNGTPDPIDIVYKAPAVNCSEWHNAELVGTATAPDGPWPALQQQWALVDTVCRDVVARYLGFPDASSSNNNYIAARAEQFVEGRWSLGDRGTRCYAFVFTDSSRRSIGAGLYGSVQDLGAAPPHRS